MAKAKTSITTENRSGSAADAAAKEQRTEMPLSDLHPFEGHPFKVLDDELMEQTVESIKQIGVVSPLIVRPDPEGGFEILSGHRRLHAAQLAGLETVPVIVKEMDDDAAIIFMVDSNLQRENILPSERAFSYKMKLEAMKHQGERGDLTSAQVGPKSWAAQVVAEEAGDSKSQVKRFIRLTNLIPEILDMVDEKKIAFNPAVELSYLKPSEQKEFLEAMDYAQASPSLSQAQRLKKLSQEGGCTLDAMCEVMNEIKKNELDHVTIKNEVLRKYFPKSYTPKQMQDTIIRLLEKWQRSKQRDMER
ncbi:ParB/RepB/Spo0J family partition protein [Stomatobaculum longum]|uniref:ParB/RepB/Spo0J family partition protein n=1 Tax=Stomatobaculum longum TaxID=796942 RepID=UPI003C77FA8C